MLLEAFRNHKRWLMFIAMILVIPSFVVTGIYSYNRMISDDGAIAKVDDVSITPQDYDEAKRRQLDVLRANLGEAFRADMLENAQARVALLERVMNDRSLTGEMTSEHIEVGEATAIEMIKSFPAFQKDGVFSAELYENYLASVGYSDAYFVHLMRNDIARQLLTTGITRTALVPQKMSKELYQLLTEKREVALHKIATADYVKSVSVTDEEGKQFWSDNQSAFARPDEIDIEYVVFTPALFADVTPSDEDIRTFYDQNPNRFRASEQRRARHILIDLTDGRDKALAEAQDVLAQVKAKPEDFAKLAEKYSDDPGSAVEGGDLGYFGRGMMIAPFEEAVFAAKNHDIIGPVETEFGFHIIEVTDIRDEGVRPFEEVKDEIVELYREQESMRRFSEEADQFTNMVYEQSDSLAPVIDKYHLTAQTVSGVSAQGVTDPEVKRFVNQHVIDNLFTDECLREKRNSQAVEVAPNTLVAARVKAYHPSRIMPFEEVRSDILQQITSNKAREQAETAGKELLAQLRSNQATKVAFDEAIELSRSSPKGQPFELINAVMRVEAKELPSYVGVSTPEAYFIAHVTKTEVKEPEARDLESAHNEIAQMYARAEQTMFLKALRDKHNAVVLHKDYMPGAQDAANDR